MKLSKSYWPTYKETPSDAQVPSHQLMMRAGFIHKNTSGIYSYLPMATKVIQKIQKIIREELNSFGSQELLMGFVTPKELWEESGRWNKMGPLMIKMTDRKGAEFCLSPTNEETITDIFKQSITSHKDLPVNLYQINTKFRDELRPRFGILRGREFMMKDGYTFDLDKAGMDVSYNNYYQAYERIFNRMGLEYIAVEADGGDMADGDSKTHEFQVIADNGEDVIITAKDIGYAANIETAVTKRAGLDFQKSADHKKVETLDMPSCAAVAAHLNIPVYQTLKSLVYTVYFAKKDGSEKAANYLVMILGDDEVNEIKLAKNFAGAVRFEPASSETLQALNLPAGYMSPIAREISVVFDEAIDLDASYVVGANEVNFHMSGFVPSRDTKTHKTADLRLAKPDDVAFDGKTPIQFRKGIEAGQVFQLGAKYTKSMNASVLDQNGKKIFPLMGCYGIGVSRTLAAAIEQHHDEDGIIWPVQLAPFDAYFAVLGKKEETYKLAEEIYSSLKNAGLDILLDDRKVSAGAMFKDSDLLGLPVRILLGERDFEASGELELKVRSTGEVHKVKKEELEKTMKSILKSLGKE